MVKTKNSIFYYMFEFCKLVFTIIKWLFVFLWNAVKWIIGVLWALAKFLFEFAKKSDEKRKGLGIEAKRPANRANYESFGGIESLEGNLSAFELRIYSNKSLIGLILGARGSGKSAIGMRILENVAAKSDKNIYCMGFNKSDLPKWIQPIDKIDEIKNDSFLLVDEGGIEFSSRDAMSSANKLLSELLLISRHKDLSVLFVSQNSSNIEINTLRQSDYLILKSPSLLQLDFERKKIKDVYEEVKDRFKKYENEIGLAYVYSDQYRGFVRNTLPSFWSGGISKSYRGKK